MVKTKKANIQITVYKMPDYSVEAIEADLVDHLSKKYSYVKVRSVETPEMFVGTNCGAEATFDLIFTDGGSPNTAIPTIDGLTSFLENIDSKAFKLGVVHQEFKYFYQYI